MLPGEFVELGVNLARIHLFDAQTGEVIPLPSKSIESAGAR